MALTIKQLLEFCDQINNTEKDDTQDYLEVDWKAFPGFSESDKAVIKKRTGYKVKLIVETEMGDYKIILSKIKS